MLRSVVVFLLIFLFRLSKPIKEVDYCTLDCDGSTNTMCRRSDCSPIPGCKEEPMTDEIRRYFVDVHNKLRNQIALGADLNFKDTVSNMRAISYDMELEEMARCHANECIFSVPNIHDKCRRTTTFTWVGQNIYLSRGSIFFNNWLHPNFTETIVGSWYDEIIYLHPDNFNFFINKLKDGISNNKAVGHFTQVIWADTYKIGCARASTKFHDGSIYKHGILFVCNYGPGGNIRYRPIVKRGTPCSDCPPNFTCHPKYTGLCVEVDKISGDDTPVLEKEPPCSGLCGEKKEKENVGYCALDCYGFTNTMCRRSDCSPVSGCKEEPMTDEIRRYFVDVHNKLRNQIALGADLNFKDTVSNMRAISYDMELEEMARCHANECIFSGPNIQDECRRTSTFTWVGQNIYLSRGSIFFNDWLHPNFTETVVGWWYDQIIYLHPDNFNFFNNKLKDGINENKGVGHFTQVIWADTYKIGCARASTEFDDGSIYKHGILFVCNYGPGGNIPFTPIVKRGTPCSNCPPNLTCHPKYTGLCVEVDKISVDTPVLEKEVDKIDGDTATLEKEVDKISGDTPVLEKELDKISGNRPALEKEVDKISWDTPVLEKEVDKVSEDTPALEKKVDKISWDAPVLEKEVDKLSEDTPALEKDINKISRGTPVLKIEPPCSGFCGKEKKEEGNSGGKQVKPLLLIIYFTVFILYYAYFNL